MNQEPEILQRLAHFHLVAKLVHEMRDVGAHEELRILMDLADSADDLSIQFEPNPSLIPSVLP